MRDGFASREDPPDLESLVQDSLESYFRSVCYLSVGVVRQSAATALWRVFVMIAGCTLVGCSCGYGLPSNEGSGVQDTHVGPAGNGGRETEGSTAGSGRKTDGGMAADASGHMDRGTTGSVALQDDDGGVDDSISRDKEGSDTNEGGAGNSGRDIDGSVTGSSDRNTDGGTASDESDCCSAHTVGGCADIDVQTCVCELDPECCQQSWDTVCVELVSLTGCGTCTQPTGDCCTASLTVGCSDLAIQTCVCAADPKCCNQGWDEFCVFLVDQLSCGICG